jgi:hypothetical protein
MMQQQRQPSSSNKSRAHGQLTCQCTGRSSCQDNEQCLALGVLCF